MDNANLFSEQKKLVKDFKEDKKYRYLLKNSVAKSSDVESRSSTKSD